ncbi:uncharacterized protein TNCV_2767351 [Trichonephila clavipes]|nr:uncharacterized protein TNCV_2767351 [Trichonephila clavipes]
MKRFLSQLLLAIGVFAAAFHSGSCQSCHLRELDLCAATLVLFNQSPTGVATNEPDLNRQCTYINEAEQCFKNFTVRCMTPLQRELLGFVSEGSEKLLNEYCTPGTDLRANYLKHAPCLNDAHSLQKDCLTDLQAAMETISTSDFQKRIPMACCGYQRYMTCARNTVEKKCGKAAVDFMQLLLRNAVSRLPDIVCTGYGSENHECHKLLPHPGTQPQGSKSDSTLSRLFAAYLGN